MKGNPRKQYPATSDVDALKKLVAEKRKEGDQILEKVKQLKKTTQSKQQAAQKSSFRFEWQHEAERLSTLQKTLEQEIERTLRQFAADEGERGRPKQSEERETHFEGSESESESNTARSEECILLNSFSDATKEHSELAVARQAMMSDVLGDISNVQMMVQQIKSGTKQLSSSKSVSEAKTQLTNLKESLKSQLAELEKEEIDLENSIAGLQSQLSSQTNFSLTSHSQASTPRASLFESPSNPSSTHSSPFSTPRPLVHSTSQQSSSDATLSRPSSARSGYSVPFSDVSSTFSDSSQLTNSSLILQLDPQQCRDIQLLENLRDDWNRMEQRFRGQLTSLRANFMSDNSISDVQSGSWDSKSHFHFMALYKQYVLKGKRSDFIERAALEMPNVPKQDIEHHLQFVRSQHIYRIHHKAIKGMWRRERTLWFENAKELIQESNALEDLRIKKECQSQELQQKQEHLHKKLATWKEEKVIKFAHAMEKLQKEEKEAKEKERILNEKLAQARSNRKRLVNEYKQTKQEMADYQRVQEEERQREFDEIKKEQDKINAERVKYREEENEQKKQAQLQKELEEQKILQMKELQLEKLREKVRVTAESDTQRTYQGTVASSVPARVLPPLFKDSHGYKDTAIVSDPRFKIERALNQAGLMNSSYAREVLASIPTKIRVDQLSSDQRDLYISKHVV